MILTILISMILDLYSLIQIRTSLTKNKKSNLVRLPILFLWVAIISNVFFLIFFLLNTKYMTEYRYLEYALYWIGCIGTFNISLAQIYWEIHFDSKENNFTYTSMFGKKTIVYYQDVTKARRYKDGVFFMVGKKIYYIDTYATNFDEFMMIFNLLTPKNVWKKTGNG